MSRRSDPAAEGEADGERLQKVLARAGIGSRRTCDELIAAGRVLVNGLPARVGQRVDVGRDVVLLDGAPVGIMPGLVYYLLNKPEGVITTASDPEGRGALKTWNATRPPFVEADAVQRAGIGTLKSAGTSMSTSR